MRPENWPLNEPSPRAKNCAVGDDCALSGGTQQALPSIGDMPVGNIALLGAGALLVGGGMLLYKKSALS